MYFDRESPKQLGVFRYVCIQIADNKTEPPLKLL